MRKLILFGIILALHVSSYATSFRNHAVTLPTIGFLQPDLTPNLFNITPWPITSRLFVGAGYRYAFDYHWWVPVETFVGFGRIEHPNATNKEAVISLSIATGVRYDFLISSFRPFISTYINYLQFFVRDVNNREISIPVGVGPKLTLGCEWVFMENMSIQAEASYLALFNIEDPFRHSVSANLSYMLYF